MRLTGYTILYKSPNIPGFHAKQTAAAGVTLAAGNGILWGFSGLQSPCRSFGEFPKNTLLRGAGKGEKKSKKIANFLKKVRMPPCKSLQSLL